MFAYKEKKFFTTYFDRLPDFEVKESFEEIKTREEGTYFIGQVLYTGACHPLLLRVEIPVNFPHGNLTFWTDSLLGYPHLIHSQSPRFPSLGQQATEEEKKALQKEKAREWSWFCLNTPFAESAEEQQHLEVSRLLEWVDKAMDPHLPARITDPVIRKALWMQMAHSWENYDEINELKQDSKLVMVGDVFTDSSKFTQPMGLFVCAHNGNQKYYVLTTEDGANVQLPFVVVDEMPAPGTKDFFDLAKQYGWSRQLCSIFLPFDFIQNECICSKPIDYGYLVSHLKSEWLEQKIRNGVDIEDLTQKNIQVLNSKKRPGSDSIPIYDGNCTAVMSPEVTVKIARQMAEIAAQQGKAYHLQPTKEDALAQIEKRKESLVIRPRHQKLVEDVYQKNIQAIRAFEQSFDPFGYFITGPLRVDYPDETAYRKACRQHKLYTDCTDGDTLTYQHNLDQHTIKSFALGVRKEGKIVWMLVSAEKSDARFKETRYDYGFFEICVSEVDGLSLVFDQAEIIDEHAFYGRSAISESLSDKKVAIIGLGAIGSQVAEALARSGVKKFGLWDSDVVEPGNICRSAYNKSHLGECKPEALASLLRTLTPFNNIQTSTIKYINRIPGYLDRRLSKDLYGQINYDSQEQVLKELADYDILIDCTASNELLHFLSYVITDKPLLSLCITNKSSNLLCLSNHDGNVFELRKHFLSRIEQDTQNYFHEGSGCYSPTFLASYSDIAGLVNLAIRDWNESAKAGMPFPSKIWSYDMRGVIADRLVTYSCRTGVEEVVSLTVGSETLADAEELDFNSPGPIAFFLGGYSADKRHIFVSHCIPLHHAGEQLETIFTRSGGILDYIGDMAYACEEGSAPYQELLTLIQSKASDEQVNTNNPIVGFKEADGALTFHLYLNGTLIRMERRE